jgi:hypothetical protein
VLFLKDNTGELLVCLRLKNPINLLIPNKMMKRNNYLKIFLVFALLACGSLATFAQTTTFNYTGIPQTYTVPAGVYCLLIDMQGAAGGVNSSGFSGPPYIIDSPGHGARVQGTLAVLPGQVITVFVGGAGGNGVSGSPTPGGYNGGGASDFDPLNLDFPGLAGGGGGGASDIRVSGVALTDRVFVAGGGGGAGGNWDYTLPWPPLLPTDWNRDKGGDGGTTTGQDGSDGGGITAGLAGLGGTPISGGSGGVFTLSFPPGSVGGSGYGGDASVGTPGGGGGSGYFGGGGATYAGGGGGSSYTDIGLVTSVTHTRGYNADGDGVVFITPGGPPSAGAISGPLLLCVGVNSTYTDPAAGALSWSSSDVTVATIVAGTGVATGVSAGICDITCTVTTVCGTSTTFMTVTVNPTPAPITGAAAICPGDSTTLSDITLLGIWSSVTPAVGTISPIGMFYGLSAGTSVVSYTVAGCAATKTITVNPIPPAIGGPGIVCLGGTVTLTDVLAGGTWASVNPAVGSIAAVSGLFGGISVDTTTISYTRLGCSITRVMTVNAGPSAIDGPDSVCVGSTTTLSDIVAGGTWSSMSPAIGSVNSTGDVTGILPGTTVIKYSIGTCVVNVTVTVHSTPAPIAGPDSVCFSGTASYTDATAGGVWNSVFPTVGMISSTGIFTPLQVNLAIITYVTAGGCTQNKQIRVVDTAMDITGGNSLCLGNTLVLADGSTGGAWRSSFPAIASVTPSGFFGIINGLSQGVDTIFYKKPICPAKWHLVTVNPLPAAITGTTAICIGYTTVLTDDSTGGAWFSSNPLVNVTPTGLVTSAVPNITDTIYYTLPTGCLTSVVVNVGIPPSTPIIPTTDTVCPGGVSVFSIGDTGGVWSTTSLAIASIVYNTGVITGNSAGTVNVSYTLPNGCYAVKPFTVKPALPASVHITGLLSAVCAGDSVTYIAHPVNGGNPTYTWKKFSFLPFASTSDTLRYPPIHGDVIMVYMRTHGICSIVDSVVDTFAVNVYPDLVSPLVTITTSYHDSVAFMGEIVTFNASVTWGGTLPVYQWFVNGAPYPGATSSSFALAVYKEDTVFCVVSGNPPCPSSFAVSGSSNGIIIHADYLGVNGLTQTTGNLSLFPNPNSGNFTLRGAVSNQDGKNVNYQISNVLGQVLNSGSTTPVKGLINAQISQNDLPAGSYLLRVNTDAGSETFHFVIAK